MEEDNNVSESVKDRKMYSLENEIPPSSNSGSSYHEVYKICREYYSELKKLNVNKEINNKLSKEDLIVLNDVINETNSYSSYLMSNGFSFEGAKLNQINLKIINVMIRVLSTSVNTSSSNINDLNKNKIDFLLYPFSLKLSALEIKFHLLFNIQKNYTESEKLLTEIINIENVLQMPRFNIGSSTFFMAIVKFCKIRLHKIN